MATNAVGREEFDRLVGPLAEAAFQAQVTRLAQGLGYLVYHTHDSRRSQAGFPDLVLVRRGRLIFAELKSQKGRLTADQALWLRVLGRTGLCEAYLWRPSDRDEIWTILAGTDR